MLHLNLVTDVAQKLNRRGHAQRLYYPVDEWSMVEETISIHCLLYKPGYPKLSGLAIWVIVCGFGILCSVTSLLIAAYMNRS